MTFEKVVQPIEPILFKYGREYKYFLLAYSKHFSKLL